MIEGETFFEEGRFHRKKMTGIPAKAQELTSLHAVTFVFTHII